MRFFGNLKSFEFVHYGQKVNRLYYAFLLNMVVSNFNVVCIDFISN
jgi:hypothetical protein